MFGDSRGPYTDDSHAGCWKPSAESRWEDAPSEGTCLSFFFFFFVPTLCPWPFVALLLLWALCVWMCYHVCLCVDASDFC